MTPTECPECMSVFMSDESLQLAALAHNRENGPEDATEFVDECLAEEHATHARAILDIIDDAEHLSLRGREQP